MPAGGPAFADRVWYGSSGLSLALLPLSWLYRLVVACRRALYTAGALSSVGVDAPVVVVGNLTAGGTGKTPVTVWLVNALRARGLAAGVVSRGYGGRVGNTPLLVTADTDPADAGDEPVLIARRCNCPVVVHPDRVAAARRLLDEAVDVVIADDGLQHYRLRRDIEIAVIDGARALGNGRLLPAGPLREPPARLATVQRVYVNGAGADPGQVEAVAGERLQRFRLAPGAFRRLADGELRPPSAFSGKRVHAVAGIGNPARFFDTLEGLGVEVIPHPLPDHASIAAGDLDFGDSLPTVMTEKDAVKCTAIAGSDCWALTVDATLEDDDMLDAIQALIDDRRSSQ